jgi:steroid delta-isomerase-like uncharacterized protein
LTAGSDANAELIGRLHRELFESGDVDAVVDAFFADGFVSHNVPPGFPPGADAVKAFFGMFRDALAEIEVTIDQLVCDRDAVAVATTIIGTHRGALFGVPPTGRRVSIAGIDIVRIADGKIVEHRGLTDTVGLLRQLGGG